ncbi:MAG: protein TolR [Pseudomonadota bacterium]
MQSGFSSGQLMSEINVTPFVDVMLVLLIIFMVTAPMMVQGVSVDLPKASSGPLKGNDNQLIISINKEQQVFINDQAVGVGFLTQKLQAILENLENREVYLRADKDVPYGVVVNVMSMVKKAGVENLGMITLPDDEKT